MDKETKKALEQVEIKIEFSKSGRQRCTARSKQTGEQCKNWALPGKTKCKFHGGMSTGPKTAEGKLAVSQNALKHGIYSNRLLTPEEEDFYYTTMEEWTKEYKLDKPNQLLLDRALRNYIKQARKDAYEAEQAGFGDDRGIILDHDSKFMKYISMLGLDRKFNMQQNQQKETIADLASLLSGLSGGNE